MPELVPLRHLGPRLGAKDPRTIAKRLEALGVPVVTFAGRRYADPREVERRVHRQALAGNESSGLRGYTLASGEEPW